MLQTPFRLNLATPCLVLFFLLCGTEVVAADSKELKPYFTSYTANYRFLLPFKGKASRELKRMEDGTWQLLHQVTSPMIQLTESSQFSVQDGQVSPSHYSYLQSTLSKKSRVEIEFDLAQQQAINSAEKEPISITLPDHSLDKLNYQLQLRNDLMQDKAIGPYAVVDKKRIKTYRFEHLGEERVTTPLGQFNAVKLRRQRKESSSRETVIWLAKDWDYLMLKIQQNENGKSYEILLAEGQLDGAPIQGLEE